MISLSKHVKGGTYEKCDDIKMANSVTPIDTYSNALVFITARIYIYKFSHLLTT